ncbi:MAG: MFS transporter [Solirubrobacterales bacterium]
MRRLLVLACSIVFLDVAFYTAIVPLLPTYVDDLGLGRTGAGLLSASYAAGNLVAAIPAGLLAARVGSRACAIGGLVLLGTASCAFGFAGQVALLDGARFLQGVGGSMAWAGAFTWVITGTPAEKRGQMIGTTLAVAVVGALLGPPLGALAIAVGTQAVFGSVLLVALLLAVAAARTPETAEPRREGLGTVVSAAADRNVLLGVAMVAVPSTVFGAEGVLVPLRIDELGGSALAIAAGFTAAAGVESVVAPFVGRYSDRAGRVAPYLAGLLVSAASLIALGLGALPLVLAATVVLGAGAGLLFTPATAALADAADATGMHQGIAAGLTNVAWAGGQVVGGLGGGAGASALGDAAPFLFISALLLVVAAGMRRFGAAALPAEAAD